MQTKNSDVIRHVTVMVQKKLPTLLYPYVLRSKTLDLGSIKITILSLCHHVRYFSNVEFFKTLKWGNQKDLKQAMHDKNL